LVWFTQMDGQPATAIFDPTAASGFVLRVRSLRSDVAFHLDGRIARCLRDGIDHALEQHVERILDSMFSAGGR